MKKSNLVTFLIKLTIRLRVLLWGIGIATIASAVPQPTLAAERIKFNYGILGFSLSVDALELFAREGIINDELHFYTKRLDKQTVKQLHRVLSRRINIDPILLYRLTRSPMVVEILENLGEVATTHRGHNGFHAIRASITKSAIARSEIGITLIDVLRTFPTENIWLDTARLIELREELTVLVEYREAIRDLVVRQAEREASLTTGNSFLPQLDLRQAGGINFIQQTITINSRIADINSGVRSREPFRAKLYLPQGLSRPVPVAILSHGFGSEPRAFSYLGEHLASYGIAAVSVEHLGSDSDYELEILEGAKKRAIASREFIERPLDIHYVLDELELFNQSDPKLKGTLDLDRVGMIGHSLGGYTTLALAGAEINTNRLQQQCPYKKISLNISLLMQCRAKDLVPQLQLADSRIKGAIAISPIVSGIFGKESLSDISIPTAIISGSEDIIAPVVQEQVYPFTWLSAKDRYLAMMIPGDHFSGSNLPRQKRCSARREASPLGVLRDSPLRGFPPLKELSRAGVSPRIDCIKKPDNPTIIEEFIGRRLSNGQTSIKAFAVAFIKAHIKGDSEYLSYLSASYARNISSSEIDFNIIRSLDLKPVEREYDNILPVILPTINR